MTGGCHFSNLPHVCGDNFNALRSPGVSGVEMKIYERWLQALLSSAPRSRVLARLASLAQIGELARRLKRKRPWDEERREAKRVSPVYSFPPFFERKFSSRERNILVRGRDKPILRASSPIWANLARKRERGAEERRACNDLS